MTKRGGEKSAIRNPQSAIEMKHCSAHVAAMSVEDFQQSVARDAAPPAGLSLVAQALWHDARRDWDRAHTCAQEDHSRDGAWVHAYLHRKEGDLGNAGYWYARAGRTMPERSVALEAEWAELVRTLVK